MSSFRIDWLYKSLDAFSNKTAEWKQRRRDRRKRARRAAVELTYCGESATRYVDFTSKISGVRLCGCVVSGTVFMNDQGLIMTQEHLLLDDFHFATRIRPLYGLHFDEDGHAL
jgi:hypothetical protein